VLGERAQEGISVRDAQCGILLDILQGVTRGDAHGAQLLGVQLPAAADGDHLYARLRRCGGDTSRGVGYRLKGDVLDLQPKAVVLLIGTNDLGLGAEPEVVAKNVTQIIRALRAAGGPQPPVIVCKVMPSDASKQRPADKIRRLNELVDTAIAEAKDPQVIRVDTFSIFADENGNARKEEFPDLLHPNPIGYGKWRAALEPVFGKLGL